ARVRAVLAATVALEDATRDPAAGEVVEAADHAAQAVLGSGGGPARLPREGEVGQDVAEVAADRRTGVVLGGVAEVVDRLVALAVGIAEAAADPQVLGRGIGDPDVALGDVDLLVGAVV